MKDITKTVKLIVRNFVNNEKEQTHKYESEKRSSFGL